MPEAGEQVLRATTLIKEEEVFKGGLVPGSHDLGPTANLGEICKMRWIFGDGRASCCWCKFAPYSIGEMAKHMQVSDTLHQKNLA